MTTGYESLIWIRDKDGSEYACYLDEVKDRNNLTEKEREQCMNVNDLVGTERW